MQGQIQVARKSKSGKNLSVQVGGVWYVSKCWEFENMVGQEITFEPSTQNFPDGGSITWINEYGVTAGTTPSDQAFNQAHAQYQPEGMAGQAPPMGSPVPPGQVSQPVQQQAQQIVTPQRPPVDRDASITALALTKCIQGISSTEMAFNAYKDLYNKVLEWNPGEMDDLVPY